MLSSELSQKNGHAGVNFEVKKGEFEGPKGPFFASACDLLNYINKTY